jgi:hypothetical protein
LPDSHAGSTRVARRFIGVEEEISRRWLNQWSKAMSADEEFIGIYDVLDALKDVIVSSDPTKREKLAKAIDGWAESTTGVQSPMLLYHLLMDIDIACREKASKPRAVIRLVDRAPEGNA